ncbi:MAG: branched-chain-amino-acid transaminase [Calditrichia bacterium]
MTPVLPDSRNENIMIYVGDGLYPRDEAKVSVFDSVVQGGDAVWEGIRVYNGRIFCFDEHMDRLFDSAHAMAFTDMPTREEIKQAVFDTLKANNMRDEAHMRLTLTRGKKVSSGMSPTNNQYGPTLIIVAEWKKPVYDNDGIRLITSSIRRNNPQCVDSKIHHNNLINNILAKIEANVAGVDDAVMLDLNGFASETNATNIFIVKKGVLLTPHADSCLPGITRALVMELGVEDGLEVVERNISISEIYSADEMFTTGSMGELSPVLEVDGRTIGDGKAGSITRQLQKLHHQRAETTGEPLPF